MSKSDHMRDMFLRRIPERATTLRSHVQDAFVILENYHAEAAKIRGNKNLTPAGQLDYMQKLTTGKIAESLSAIGQRIDGPLADIKSARIGLRKEIVKSENHSEARKQEVRAYLRSLEHPERVRLAMESDDTLIREAIVNAPPFLSGLQQDIYDRVVDAFVEQQHPERIKTFDENEGPLLEAAAALKTIREEIERDVSATARVAA